jgi:hypothetical protein
MARVLLLIVLFHFSFGIETVQLSNLQRSRNPTITIVDPNGSAIGGAAVEKCKQNWRSCLRIGLTDAHGKFQLPLEKSQQFITIRKELFNPLQFRVQIDATRGKNLILQLQVAT